MSGKGKRTHHRPDLPDPRMALPQDPPRSLLDELRAEGERIIRNVPRDGYQVNSQNVHGSAGNQNARRGGKWAGK